jgi:hypothetical protein
MRIMRRVALALLAGSFGGPGAGCTPAPPSNLSPTPDQAAGRHEQATQYSLDLARRNQQAEKKAMSKLARSPNRR